MKSLEYLSCVILPVSSQSLYLAKLADLILGDLGLVSVSVHWCCQLTATTAARLVQPSASMLGDRPMQSS